MLKLFSKNTRMMVIMSIIAVMLRKLISGSARFFAIALRSSRLYVTMLAGLEAAGGEGWLITSALRR